MSDSHNEERIKLKLDSESDYHEYYDKVSNKENVYNFGSTMKKYLVNDQDSTIIAKCFDSSMKRTESLNSSTSDKFMFKSRTQKFVNFDSKPRHDSQDSRNTNLQNYNNIKVKDGYREDIKEARSRFDDSLANTTELDSKEQNRIRVESRESTLEENEYKCQKC